MNGTETTLRFGIDEAQRAADEWRFNCGPGALCAILGMTPDEIRPHMLSFERKGYTDPTLMKDVLHGLKCRITSVYQDQYGKRTLDPVYPTLGLVRVQWAGPWTQPGVPMRVRYRHTHWIGCRTNGMGREAFDINSVYYGGWLPWDEWSQMLVPWLIKTAVPKSSGEWWPTHCWEVVR